MFLFLHLIAQDGVAASSSINITWTGGEPFVTLRDMASYYGMTYTCPNSKTVELKSRWSRLTFSTQSRKFQINGVWVWLHEGLRSLRGEWLMTRTDAQRLIDPVLRSSRYLKKGVPRIVMLDAGHGGKDTGTVGNRNVQEKLVALDVAKRVRKHLKKLGVNAVLTRDKDKYVSLPKRVNMANRRNTDLFVSIHFNSSKPSAKGVETFILTSPGFQSTNTSTRKRMKKLRYPGTPFDHSSTVAGYAIHKKLISYTKAPDRGLKEARFYVLKNVKCPAVLVECGFLSNSQEQKKVLDSKYRDTIAHGIAYGIFNYVNECRRTSLCKP